MSGMTVGLWIFAILLFLLAIRVHVGVGMFLGGAAAFLTDHNCSRSEAVFLPFLGRVAAVNMGPAVLALRAKAPIIPVFLLRRPDGRYEYLVEPPLETAGLTGGITSGRLQNKVIWLANCPACDKLSDFVGREEGIAVHSIALLVRS